MTAVKESVPARVDARFGGGMASLETVDVPALRRRLRETVEGEVRFDAGARALCVIGASNYRQVPVGVVIPKTLADVVATHRSCHEFHAPVLARGGNIGNDSCGVHSVQSQLYGPGLRG